MHTVILPNLIILVFVEHVNLAMSNFSNWRKLIVKHNLGLYKFVCIKVNTVSSGINRNKSVIEMCVTCMQTVFRKMGLTDTKQIVNAENSISPEANIDERAYELTHSKVGSGSSKTLDNEVINEIALIPERLVKLRRTCSKYTALEGKAANVGEIYDIDDDFEIERYAKKLDNLGTYPIYQDCKIPRAYGINRNYENGVSNIVFQTWESSSSKLPVTTMKRDIQYRTGKTQKDQRYRQTKSQNSNSNHVEKTRRNLDDLRGKTEEYDGMGPRYVSKSITMPFNNFCVFSTSIENDSSTECVSSDSRDHTCANDPKHFEGTYQKRVNLHRKLHIPEASDASADFRCNNQLNGKKQYRLLRYPLRVKVHPYSDICEVSLPRNILHDLQVSSV